MQQQKYQKIHMGLSGSRPPHNSGKKAALVHWAGNQKVLVVMQVDVVDMVEVADAVDMVHVIHVVVEVEMVDTVEGPVALQET